MRAGPLHRVGGVVRQALRLVTEIDAALIDGDDRMGAGQDGNLILPAVPEVWVAVNEDHEWSMTGGDVVSSDAALLDESFTGTRKAREQRRGGCSERERVRGSTERW